MDDIFRKRLSKEELEQYDHYDHRAILFAHLVVWPGIIGLVFYGMGRMLPTLICLAIVLPSIPMMITMGKRARKLRELAESRYAAIMGMQANDDKPAS